jgi:predicted HTH transcriptional regulator
MAEASRAETQRQLVELLDYPREDLDTEIKDWLQLEYKRAQADLARELIALANHGGGFLLFGFLDQDEGWSPSGPCPFPLKHYSQDAINNVLKTYAEPPFECFVDRLESAAGNTHVVIRVPGDHRVPIRSKRAGPDGSRLKIDTYYLRRPGAESAPPQSAREWDDLLRRCLSAHREELLEGFRNIEPSCV